MSGENVPLKVQITIEKQKIKKKQFHTDIVGKINEAKASFTPEKR